MTRRHAFWSVLLAANPASAQPQPPLLNLAGLFPAHTPARLPVLLPILARRQSQLQALRAFSIPDHVSPRNA